MAKVQIFSTNNIRICRALELDISYLAQPLWL